MVVSETLQIFIAFGVKMLQMLSTENTTTGNAISRATSNVFMSLNRSSLDSKQSMGEILRQSNSSLTRSESGALGKVRNLFSKSSLKMVEHLSVEEQGSSFQKMREDISRYISFMNDVVLPMYSRTDMFVSVVPMTLSILLSGLSQKQGGSMNLLTQLEQILSVAKLGTNASMAVKLNRLKDAQRQNQSSFVSDGRTRYPDLVGAMIHTVETDGGSSSTSGLDAKIGVLTQVLRLVK